MNKKLLRAIVVLVFLSLSVVAVDYASLFGRTTSTSLEFADVRYRTISQVSGDLIMNVKVRCFQHRNNRICTNKKSGRAGEVLFSLPYQKVTESSLFFEHATRRVSMLEAPLVNIMFIHNDYLSATETVSVNDIISGELAAAGISLQPREQTYHEAIHE